MGFKDHCTGGKMCTGNDHYATKFSWKSAVFFMEFNSRLNIIKL